MTFPTVEMVIAKGRTVLPKFSLKTLSKNNAAMNFPLSSPHREAPMRSTIFTSKYSKHTVSSEETAHSNGIFNLIEHIIEVLQTYVRIRDPEKGCR